MVQKKNLSHQLWWSVGPLVRSYSTRDMFTLFCIIFESHIHAWRPCWYTEVCAGNNWLTGLCTFASICQSRISQKNVLSRLKLCIFLSFLLVTFPFFFVYCWNQILYYRLNSNIFLVWNILYQTLPQFRPPPREKKDNASQKMKAKKDIDIQMPWSGFNILNVGLLNDHDGFFYFNDLLFFFSMAWKQG